MKNSSFLALLFTLAAMRAFAQSEPDDLLHSGFAAQTAQAVRTADPMKLSSGPDAQAGFIAVKLRLMKDVSSSSAKSGQPVTMEVAEAVYEENRLLVAKGALADAVVSKARHRGHNRRDGEVAVTVRSVRDIDGQQRPVRLATLETAGNKGLPIFGPCTFPIPADPVGLFRRGKDMTIRKGYEITVAVASAPVSRDVRQRSN